MMPKPTPARPSAKAMAARIALTPDQQKMLDEFNAGIAQALANNINENVRQEQAEQGPQKPVALPTEPPPRVECFDVEGMPVSLGNVPGCPYSSAAWDAATPRVFDPVSARRNGAPITWAQFRAMVERLRRDAEFRRFMKAATKPPSGDSGR